MVVKHSLAGFVPVLMLVVVAAGLVGCSSSERKTINETVARNTIAVAGTKQFRDSGHSLDGILSCKTESKTTTKVTVGCTGKTEDGEPVALLGATSDARQVTGTFVGTVSSKQVFKTDCLGC
jgi:hypothetical protein